MLPSRNCGKGYRKALECCERPEIINHLQKTDDVLKGLQLHVVIPVSIVENAVVTGAGYLEIIFSQ